ESSNVISIKFPQLIALAEVDDLLNKPVLIKDANRKSTVLLYSKEKENIEIIGVKEKTNNILLSGNILPGKNVLSLVNDLSGYRSIKISFKSSHKEVELKL
ncbi:MAG: hypothetical protein ACYC6D_06545, partial [Melioribacteraceae bacterium]